MNKELLEKVKERILAEPKQFNMDSFFDVDNKAGVRVPNCGTTACIAGWALAISRRQTPEMCNREIPTLDSAPLACEVLGITTVQGNVLFYEDNWPVEFRSERDEWDDPDLVDDAQRAAARIDHFIRTGE